MVNMLERWSLFGQKLLKFFNAPWRVELRFLFLFHEIMIHRIYTVCLILTLISAYIKYTYLTVGLLFLICCLFLIETVFLFQKFKDERITKFLKIVWKPLKYVVGLVIAIWSIGEANTYVYMQLGGEVPHNYAIAVNALASIFTLILVFIGFSLLFFIVGNILVMFLSKSDGKLTVFIARFVAFIVLSFALFFASSFFEAIIKQDIGKRIIAHTIFYPNLKCININKKYPDEPISIINNSDFALVYNRGDRNIYRVKCKE